MRFFNIYILYAVLILIPIVIFFYVYSFKQKKQAYSLFANIDLLNKINLNLSWERQYIKATLTILGIFFIGLALCRPQFGTKMVEVKRKGIDVIIALDVSLSMQTEDMKPSRLAVAKREISKFSDMLEGDRIGLVVFAGESFVQCPLTLDYSAFKMFLDMQDSNSINVPGTAVGKAINTATSAFSKKEMKHKVLILFTDGEDHDSSPIEAAKEAAKEGIKIYTIGIGSAGGEPIPIKNEQNAMSGYKKDTEGKVVMSRLDETTLKKIALLTGGKYYHATQQEIELERVLKEISQMEKKELSSGFYRQYEEQFFYPLFLGLVLLIIEFFIPENKKVKV